MRKLLIGFCIVVALMILAAIILPLFVGLDTYKRMAVERGEAVIGRPISVGDMRLSLWGGASVELRNLRIGNAPGFSPDAALAADRMSIRLKLRPLLRGEVQFDSVLLERPIFLIERGATGTNNLSDLVERFGGGKPTAPEQRAGGDGPSVVQSAKWAGSVLGGLFIGNISVRDGTIAVRRGVSGPEKIVERRYKRIDFSVEDFAFGRPFTFSLAAQLGPGGEQNARASGTIGGLTPELALDAIIVDGKLEVSKLRAAWLAEISANILPLRGGTLSARANWQGTLGRYLALTGSITGEGLQVGARQVALDLPAKLALDSQLRFDMAHDRLSIERAALTADGQTVLVEGSVEPFSAPPRFALRARGDTVLLERLVPLFPDLGRALGSGFELRGPMQFSTEIRGDLERWSGNAQFDLRDISLKYANVLAKPSGRRTTLQLIAAGGGSGVKLDQIDFNMPPLAISAAGDLAQAQLQLSGKANVADKDVLKRLGELLPALTSYLPADMALDGPLALNFNVQGKAGALKLGIDLDLTPNTLRYKDVLSKPAGVRASLTARAILGRDSLALDQLRLALGDLVLEGAGKVQNFNNPQVDLSLTSNNLALDSMSHLFPRLGKSRLTGAIQLRLAAKGRPGTPEFLLNASASLRNVGPLEQIAAVLSGFGVAVPPELQLSGMIGGDVSMRSLAEGIQVQADIDLRSSGLSYSTLFSKRPGESGKLRLDGKLQGKDMAVDNLDLEIGVLRLEGKGSVRNLADPDIDLSFTITLRPPQQVPPGGGRKTELSGRGKLSAQVRGKADNLRGLSVIGSLDFPELIAQRGRFLRVRGALELSGGILSLRQMRFEAFGGRQESEASINLAAAEPILRLKTKLEGMQVDQVLRAYTEAGGALTGTLDARFSIEGRGADADTLKRSLNGSGHIRLNNGVIKNFDVLDQAARLANLLGADFGARRERGTHFNELSSPVHIQNGLVTTPEVVLHSRDVDVTGSGSFDLDLMGRYKIEATLSAEASRQLRGNIASLLRNARGRIVVPLALSGDLTNPKVRPGKRLAELLATNIAGSLLGARSGEQAHGDPVSRLMSSLFGSISGRGEGPAEPTANRATPQTKKAGKQPGDIERGAKADGPMLSIVARPGRVQRSQPIEIFLTLTPGSRAQPVDGYVVIELPDKQWVFIDGDGRFSKQKVPLRAHFPPVDFSGLVLKHTIRQEPRGTYKVFAVLVEAGSDPLQQDNWVAPLARTSFVVE